MDNRAATSQEEIWNWVEDFFHIRLENQRTYFEHLFDSMPVRLAKVLEVGGDVIDY